MEVKQIYFATTTMEGMEAKTRLIPSWRENSFVLMEVYKGMKIHPIPTLTSQYHCFESHKTSSKRLIEIYAIFLH